MAANASPPRLPILATAGTAYALTYRHFDHFLQIAWRWLLLLFAIVFGIDWLVWPWEQSEVQHHILFWTLELLTNSVPVFIGAVIAVPWHRHLVLGEDKPNHFASIDQTKLRYFVAAWAIFIVSCLPFMVMLWLANATEGGTMGVDLAISLLGIAVLVFLPALAWRASIWLPGLALRENVDLKTTWLQTKGNTLRIYATGILCILPYLFAMFLLIAVITAGASNTTNRVSDALMSATVEVCYLLIGLSGLTFLTVAYRHFFPQGSTGTKSA